MAVPVSEKDALRKQLHAMIEAEQAVVLLKDPQCQVTAALLAEKQVLELCGISDYAARMSELEVERIRLEEAIQQLNDDTVAKVAGISLETGRRRKNWYSQNLDTFSGFPDETQETLERLKTAKTQEILAATATGQELQQLTVFKNEFDASILLCSNHKQVQELWDLTLTKLGRPRDGRQLTRLNMEGRHGTQVSTCSEGQ